ncbi:MAG: hypothetical protein J5843_00355, partial [Clostridia bacterium]|nr:hypothetical protein [Clostridia bacterium]
MSFLRRSFRIVFPCLLACALILPLPFLLSGCTEPGPQDSADNTGSGLGSPEDSVPDEPFEPEEPIVSTFHYSGTEYDLTAVQEDTGEEGFFYFDRTVCGDTAPDAPDESGDFTDLAVCNGILCAVFENEPAILPETGFVIRIRNAELKRAPEPGIGMRTSLYTESYLPEEYVMIGSKPVEIRYRNIVRIDDNAGFLFDDGWYTSTTFSNIWGTEMAVDKDGTVLEIRPSGNENSGNTPIPESGYVLAVGAGSTYESIILSASIGEKVEHISERHLYTVRKFTFSQYNPEAGRTSPDLLYLSGADYEQTPAGSGTEILIGKDGIVKNVIANAEGGNAIPEGGYAVCASGREAAPLAAVVNVGDLCVQTAAKMIAFLKTPQTMEKLLIKRIQQAKDDVYKVKFDYDFIDYKKADALYASVQEEFEKAKGKDRAAKLLRTCDLLDELYAELVPGIPFGERAAWVTVGETDAEGNPYLHYKDDEAVKRSVSYAKSLNLTTLIIDPLASGYAVYPSSVQGFLPHPELGSFDVVKAFAQACEEADIDLVVMPCALLSVSASTVYPKGHYVNLYESKRLKTQKGRTVDGYGAIAMDPSDPVIRKMITDMVTELQVNYPEIDGVQMDYIRYPLPVYYQLENYEDFGYSSPASEAFEKQYKVNPATLKINSPK